MSETAIALVTGGARGIGHACAQALQKDGYRLVLADIDGAAVQTTAQDMGDGTVGYEVDTGNPDQISDLFARLEADVGPVSVLVNNAGISLPGDFLSYPIEDFQRVLAVNLTGVFAATQRAANGMIAAGIKGAIVNMSSINAQVAIPGIPAYCASKGGVMQVTKSAALALAPHGIRVNAVGPGSIDTDMLAAVNASPEAMATALSRTPLRRIGAPREIADVVAFLASDKASYITGETIYVDGGRLGLNYTC